MSQGYTGIRFGTTCQPLTRTIWDDGGLPLGLPPTAQEKGPRQSSFLLVRGSFWLPDFLPDSPLHESARLIAHQWNESPSTELPHGINPAHMGAELTTRQVANWLPSLQFDEYLRILLPAEGGGGEYSDAMAYDLETPAGLGKDECPSCPDRNSFAIRSLNRTRISVFPDN